VLNEYLLHLFIFIYEYGLNEYPILLQLHTITLVNPPLSLPASKEWL